MLESLDGGKPIRESRDVDLPLAAAHFFYYAGWADKLEYAFPNRTPRPLGVAGQIIPWNFPLLMLAWKIAPALACGNTVVLKPAETTPLTALLFARLLRRVRQAELPPGVVNIVTGDGRTGADARAARRASTRSRSPARPRSARTIQRELAGTGKKLTLELGGKAANIVFDDAPLDQAVEGIVNGIYFNQGHVCCAGSRLLVQESIYEQLIAKLKRRMGTLRVGDPLDKNTDVGAINSREQLEKITELVESGKEEGAEIYQPPCRLPEQGYWFAPTVFTNVAQSYRIAQEEIFGPVLSVLTFRTPEEAVEKANNTAVRALRRASGRRRARASSGWSSGCAPASSGRTRSTASTRRRRSAATRSPASAARAAGTASSRYLRFDCHARARCAGSGRVGAGPLRQEDVQALHRRRVPALRVRAHVRGRGPERRPRLAQGRPRRRPRRARRLPGWVGHDRLQPRSGALPARGDDGGPRGRARRASARGETEVEAAIDRVVWYAGWADKLAQVLGSSNPVAGPVLQLHRPGADRRRRRSLAPGRACARRPRLARRARRSSAATRSSSSPPRRIRSRRSSSPRRSRPRTFPAGVVNILTGLPRRARAVARGAHGRERDRRHRRRRRDARSSSGSRPTTSSASSTVAAGRAEPVGDRRASSS